MDMFHEKVVNKFHQYLLVETSPLILKEVLIENGKAAGLDMIPNEWLIEMNNHPISTMKLRFHLDQQLNLEMC
jgi:hypothetical protein